MARALLRYTVTVRARDASLLAVGNAAVTVHRQSLGTTPLMYASEVGGAALANPLLSNETGEVAVWLADGESLDVDVTVTDNGGSAHRGGLPSRTVRFAAFTDTLRAIGEGAGGGAGSEPSLTLTFTNTDDVLWNHGLGKYPDVVCRESDGTPVAVAPIYESLDALRVLFVKQRTGTLIINN